MLILTRHDYSYEQDALSAIKRRDAVSAVVPGNSQIQSAGSSLFGLLKTRGINYGRIQLRRYRKGLPPEAQEQAVKCSSMEELLKLADEYSVEIPVEALDAVSGGGCFDKSCPHSSLWRTGYKHGSNGYDYCIEYCAHCGYKYYLRFLNGMDSDYVKCTEDEYNAPYNYMH